MQYPDGWNDTATPYPRDATIDQLFAEQATRTPTASAVVSRSGTLTYEALERRANQLAHYLRSRGVKPGARVGLCMARTAAQIVATLAVIKAGAAYVPLDPTYPAERLAFLVADAELTVVVTAGAARASVPAGACLVVDLETEHAAIARRPEHAPLVDLTPGSCAYVMYTSGSTGQPKGAVVHHRGVIRLVSETNYVEIAPGDGVAQLANCAFDAATFEIWGALLNGARLELIEHDAVLTPATFGDQLRRRGIDVLFVTPALFSRIAHEAPAAFASIRDLIVGGDVLDPRAVQLVQRAGGPAQLINAYGPTEATVFSSFHVVSPITDADRPIPIGRPVANTRLYILDDSLRPVSLGEPGELFIGGDGVGGGYLGRPALTAEKFLPDPFAADPLARMYRTGDRARLGDDGAEFLGRLDAQLKLRGYRIEPGEIEAALRTHRSVSDAAVAVRDHHLVAYVVARDRVPSPSNLADHLHARLPSHMVPTSFVALSAMPLTPSGKLDRAALPTIDAELTPAETAAVAR